MPAYSGINRGRAFTQVEMRISYWSEYASEEIRLAYVGLGLLCNKNGTSNIHGIPSVADKRAIVAVEVAKSRKFAPNGDGSKHEETEEIVKPDVIVKEDVEDWDREGILTTERVETNRMRCKV